MPRRTHYRLSLATLLAVFALLTAGTFVLGKTVSRYQHTTDNLIVNFPNAPGEQVVIENWNRVDALDGVRFGTSDITVQRTEPGLSWAEVRYPLPPAAGRATELLASGVMASRDVAIGEKNWHVALFGVFFYDENNERIKRAGVTVQALAGDASPLRHERSMPVPDNATHFGVLLRLFNTTGHTSLSEPAAVLVQAWPQYAYVLLGLAIVWGAFSLAVLFALIERGSLLVAILPLAVIATILVGVALPGDHLRSVLLPLFKAAQATLPIDLRFGLTNVAKIGHALGFAALAFFALAVRRRIGATFLGIALFLVVLAVATEAGQLFLTGRNGRLLDIAIDLAGAGAGTLCFGIAALLTLPFRR